MAKRKSEILPHGLTLTQMLHQCGYLIADLIQHEETPPAVRHILIEMMDKIRTELDESDASRAVLARIEAHYLFAPMVHRLAELFELSEVSNDHRER